ncbi:MAG: UDP-N-acetylmuramate--L-alanine ligase, partial [Candidatus Krumholzibacteriota bacterium]|nr:UDP-N-acetylmuramate--L-alanine ligase [Candidatus Krumholzibacteriota bacterium]
SETPIPGVSSENLVSSIAKTGRADVHYASSFAEMVEAVAKRVESGDVVLTLGAGDIYKAGELLLERLGLGD